MNIEHIPGYLCISAGLVFALLTAIRRYYLSVHPGNFRRLKHD